MSHSAGKQSIWTLADYARVADWIGAQNNNQGVTGFEIEKHFKGCGAMRHRIGTMKRQGIIQPVPLTNGDNRPAAKLKVKYMQVRKIEAKEKPLPRGQGFPCLTKYSTPLERPTTMNSPVSAPFIAPPQVRREPAHEVTVSFNAAIKMLTVKSKDTFLSFMNVDLKLDIDWSQQS